MPDMPIHPLHRGTSYGVSSAPITAEGATLPTLRAAGFEARVNAYVVGRTQRVVTAHERGVLSRAEPGSSLLTGARQETLSPGCAGGVTDLWYLSLVGPHGQGTTMRALWANLVSNRDRSVWLEGVGSVALGGHRLDLKELGYPIHWTFRQSLIPPSRDTHGVLEADALTCYDPLLIPDTRHRRDRPDRAGERKSSSGAVSRSERPRRDASADGAFTLSSRSSGDREGGASSSGSAGSGESAEVAAAREAHPVFLLLVPTSSSAPSTQETREADNTLARLHLRFLATRIAWLPYYPTWAAYIWQRSLERGEAEPLAVWRYTPPPLASVAGEAEAPVIAGPFERAYLCRPDPLALSADLQQAIRSGVFVRHERSARSPLNERQTGTQAA
ncbi:MAG TPA: hypothetical protein VE338_11410 [Ktedonobacterales bacterium]|jgi:hypothetical protein|nr:hypothetical protein [Ktedonobacterales bacterium]